MDRRRRGIIFYRVILPGFTLVNLGLGIFTLMALQPAGWLGWMELGTGVFCCAIAGWLAGAGWSKAYWGSAMERQVTAWRRIVDAMFCWIEEAPVPADSLRTLKRSLDETLVTGETAGGARHEPPDDTAPGGPAQTRAHRSSGAVGRVS
jgi:hypothetical protein